MKKLEEIIIIYPSYDRGGVTHNLVNFMNYCTRNNIKLIFISNIKKENFFKKKNKIKLISLNNGLLSKYRGRFVTSFNSILQLALILNKKK